MSNPSRRLPDSDSSPSSYINMIRPGALFGLSVRAGHSPTLQTASCVSRASFRHVVTGNERKGRETQARHATQQAVQEMYSTLCPLKVVEVNSLGHFIRILNISPHQDLDISGYILWQLEGEHAVSMYRFPQNLLLPALQHITIWASAANVSHNPPTDLVWKGRVYFRSNPQCITVLARPNGQPVASLKTDESPYLYTTARPSLSQNQKTITRSVMEQHRSNSSSPPTTALPSVSAIPCPGRRTIESMSYPTGIRKKLSLNSKNPGMTRTDSSPALVTWHPCRLNTNSPLVRLVVQKTARSKHGFNFLSHIPFTFDLLRL